MMRKDRIQARLDALGITQFDAAIRAGKNSHFVYDFMIGRKKSFKGDGPIRLAQALQCSIEYLTGESAEVGRPPLAGPALPHVSAASGLPVAGVVMAGVFRRPGMLQIKDEYLPFPPWPLYPADKQCLYIVRGNGMDARGIVDGMVLTAVSPDAIEGNIRSGSVVVVEHVRRGGEVELSAREIQHYPDRTEFLARSHSERIPPIILRDRKTNEAGGRLHIKAVVIGAPLSF